MQCHYTPWQQNVMLQSQSIWCRNAVLAQSGPDVFAWATIQHFQGHFPQLVWMLVVLLSFFFLYIHTTKWINVYNTSNTVAPSIQTTLSLLLATIHPFDQRKWCVPYSVTLGKGRSVAAQLAVGWACTGEVKATPSRKAKEIAPRNPVMVVLLYSDTPSSKRTPHPLVSLVARSADDRNRKFHQVRCAVRSREYRHPNGVTGGTGTGGTSVCPQSGGNLCVFHFLRARVYE